MQYHDHPEDERLAALAGGDPDVTGDTSLRQHVSACDRCGPMVDELAGLRIALAELPDLAPSRPIQLVPPIPSPQPRRGPLAWLRTLAGPAMAAGVGLALVGAVGLGGLAVGGAASGGAPMQNLDNGMERASGQNDAVQPSAAAPGFAAGQTPSPTQVPAAEQGDRSAGEPPALTDTSTPLPWLSLLLIGVALLLIGLVLRFTIRPRAG